MILFMLKTPSSRLKWQLMIFLHLLVTGCASQHSVSPYSTLTETRTLWRQHQHELRQIEKFNVSGSIAYFSDSKRYFARFYLNQSSKGHYELILTTPLGSRIFKLTVNNQLATLTSENNKVYQSDKAEQLLQKLTGMAIPLKTLNAWLIGLSVDSKADKINSKGLLSQTMLDQTDAMWAVIISKYHENGRIPLPARIELEHRFERIKLTINKWTL